MTYLLDTHHMLWAITETKKLSRAVKEIITDPEQRILVSAISFWEVSLKSAIGKLTISGFSAEEFPEACLQQGFELEPLSAADSGSYHRLTAAYHKDPFDRMLIWQALRNNYTLISADSTIKKYRSEGLKIF